MSETFIGISGQKRNKKGESQCLSAPKHRSFYFNLSTLSLHAALHLSLSPGATYLPFSAFLVLPRFLCFLYHVLFIECSSCCLAQCPSLLCSFMLSLLSQFQFSLFAPPACCFPHGLASLQTSVFPILPSWSSLPFPFPAAGPHPLPASPKPCRLC